MSTGEIVNAPSHQVAVLSPFMQALAEQAKEAAAKERPNVGKISIRAGIMSYGGTPVEGNKIDAVILSAAFRRVLYMGKFDADNVVNPNCFALALENEDLVPHDNVGEPQNTVCKGCKWDEWGTSGDGRRGKKCKETRRVVMMPVSALASVDSIKSAEVAILDVPVTSTGNYSTFVNVLSATASVPPWAAVTAVGVRPNVKTQIEVTFQPLRKIEDEALLMTIHSRIEQANAIALEPYEETTPMPSAEELAEEAEAAMKAAAKKKKF